MADNSDSGAGHRKRLKHRFLLSPEAIPDYELLELIIYNAIPRRDVKPLAKALLAKHKNFAKLINCDLTKTKEIIDSEQYTQIPESLYFQFALMKESMRRILKEEISEKVVLSSWNALYDYLQGTIGHQNTENFRVLYLNTKNHLLYDEVQEYGTIDQTNVYPREIVKKAIYYDAAAIILSHNHPSGVANPSKADITLTKKIVEACGAIDVAVHDHVIVAGNKIFSFKANNLL